MKTSTLNILAKDETFQCALCETILERMYEVAYIKLPKTKYKKAICIPCAQHITRELLEKKKVFE